EGQIRPALVRGRLEHDLVRVLRRPLTAGAVERRLGSGARARERPVVAEDLEARRIDRLPVLLEDAVRTPERLEIGGRSGVLADDRVDVAARDAQAVAGHADDPLDAVLLVADRIAVHGDVPPLWRERVED